MRSHHSSLTVSYPKSSSLSWKLPFRRSASFTSPTPPRAASLSTFKPATRRAVRVPWRTHSRLASRRISRRCPWRLLPARRRHALFRPQPPPSLPLTAFHIMRERSLGRHPARWARVARPVCAHAKAPSRGGLWALAAYGGRHLRRCACVCQRCKASRTCCSWSDTQAG